MVTGRKVDEFDLSRRACYRKPEAYSQAVRSLEVLINAFPRGEMCPFETTAPMREDVARVDPGGIAILRGTGADRIGFLHRLTTGRVQGTSVGAGCRSLLLDSKGHVVGDLCVCVTSDEVRLLTAAAAGQGLAAALGRYAVMDDFAVAVEADIAVTALHGPGSAQALRRAGVGVPEDFAARPPWSHIDAASPFGSLWLVRSHELGADGLWAFGAVPVCSDLVASLDLAGVRAMGPELTEALRIEAGEPRFGAEITGDTLPMELGLASALDQEKGCYLGQETIVRVRDRGLVRRRLAGLRLRSDGMAAAGDAIGFEHDPAVGRVTSVSRVPGQAAVALALLATTVPVGAEVQISHGAEVLAAAVTFDRPIW